MIGFGPRLWHDSGVKIMYFGYNLKVELKIFACEFKMGGASVARHDYLVVSTLRCALKMEYEERERSQRRLQGFWPK